MTKHTILFVDDEANVLHALYRLFRREGYNLFTAGSGREGLELIEKHPVSLVISDQRMPEMSGVEFLQGVKERSPDTIRIILTGYADIKASIEAINKGEVQRYITKPWDDTALKLMVKDLLERYELKKENNHLFELSRRQNKELDELNRNLEKKVEERTRQLKESFFTFIKTCVDLLELVNPYLGGHSKRVAQLARELAVKMGGVDHEVRLIEAAALLHDIGLIGMPRQILKKGEQRMNETEKFLFRQHPVRGQEAIARSSDLRQVGLLIRSHHEGYSGRGYPDGLKGEEIPLGSKIICAVNFFDNLLARRMSKDFALERLKGERGLDLDPEVVNSLLEIIGRMSEGMKGKEGIKEIPFSKIAEGMVLAGDILNKDKVFLLPKGTVLTPVLIEKLRKFNRAAPIVDRILIKEK